MSVVSIGVTGEDCSYKNCKELLDIMGMVPSLSDVYCSTRKMLEKCLERTVVPCPNTNIDTFNTILQQYESTEPCSDNSTSTSSVIPSSSVVIPQATSTIDCTYHKCQTWLNYLNTLRNFSSEYCRIYKEFSTCVGGTFEQCGENNKETFFVLFGQLQIKPECPNIVIPTAVTTTAVTTTAVSPSPTTATLFSPIPSSSAITPQALDCTYDECQTWLGYLNTLEDLTSEYCQAHKEFSTCVGDTFTKCNENNMDTFIMLFGQLSIKPNCNNTVATTTTTTTVTSTTVHPSPTMTSSAIPSPTITLDCTFHYCGDLVERLQRSVPGNPNYCQYRKEASDCLEYTFSQCPFTINYIVLVGIIDEHQQCNDTTPSPTSTTSSSTSTITLSPTPTCLDGAPTKNVIFNDNLPEFLPPKEVDNEHRCGGIFQQKDLFYHCSFYTYSHLRAFRSTDLYTCSSPGLWALFSHSSLQVTVLNIVPDLRGPYTLVDEVSVVTLQWLLNLFGMQI